MHKPVTFTASPHTKYASLLPHKKKEVKIKLIFAPKVDFTFRDSLFFVYTLYICPPCEVDSNIFSWALQNKVLFEFGFHFPCVWHQVESLNSNLPL
jgi:hypothetical protein